jgi:hypothetical protein
MQPVATNWAHAAPVAYAHPMTNRRMKRSTDPLEAIQFLLEALADRSDARAVALVHSNSRVVAGVGSGPDLRDLRALAEPVARGEVVAAVEQLDASVDVFSRPVAVGASTLYLERRSRRVSVRRR